MWIVWVILAVAVFFMVSAISKKRKANEETPLQILERRYASGDISEHEFNRMKEKLGG